MNSEELWSNPICQLDLTLDFSLFALFYIFPTSVGRLLAAAACGMTSAVKSLRIRRDRRPRRSVTTEVQHLPFFCTAALVRLHHGTAGASARPTVAVGHRGCGNAGGYYPPLRNRASDQYKSITKNPRNKQFRGFCISNWFKIR